MVQQLYRLFRKNTDTGVTGHDTARMTGDKADQRVRAITAKHPGMSHRAEPAHHTK